MKSILIFPCVLLVSTFAIVHASAQTPRYKLGAQLWERDSVGMFVVARDGGVVVCLHRPDSSVKVLDALTGNVRYTLPGPRLYEYNNGDLFAVGGNPIAVSPDGKLCCIGDMGSRSDSSETIRMHDLTDGRKLWERKMVGGAVVVSNVLNRVFVSVAKVDGANSYHGELLDSRDGRLIRKFEPFGKPFIDEHNGRLYLVLLNWNGETGTFIVEFNTETGAELRKWRKGATEPFCVSSTGESLVMFGADPNNEYLRRIRHVNLATGIETVVFKCDEAMLYSCFTGARPEFNPSVSGTHAFTSNTYHYFGDTVLSYEIDLDNGPTSLTKISNSFTTWR